MLFQDNVIKEYLKNVYFITGTPCGGKTTISRLLAQRHGYLLYAVDERFDAHREMASPIYQPSMTKTFSGADEFFGRSVEEYLQWLHGNTREQFDFVLLDLIRLSQKQIVLCDCHLTVEQADAWSDLSRVVFLLRDPTALVEEYCSRPDHSGYRDFLSSASDPAAAKALCNETLRRLNQPRYDSVRESPYFWLERTEQSTVENTLAQVERHFGWQM